MDRIDTIDSRISDLILFILSIPVYALSTNPMCSDSKRQTLLPAMERQSLSLPMKPSCELAGQGYICRQTLASPSVLNRDFSLRVG
jgi:hypothetical protein